MKNTIMDAFQTLPSYSVQLVVVMLRIKNQLKGRIRAVDQFPRSCVFGNDPFDYVLVVG